MDIGIFLEYKGQVVQIPVNPPKFEVQESGNNATTEVIALGEIILPKKKKLASVKWDSFFPYESWHPAVRTKGGFKSAQFYIDFINKIRDDCKPAHLTVTGIEFDADVVVDSFTYYHQAGDHEDTYYSISLKRYQNYSIVSVPAPQPDADKSTTSTTDKTPTSSTDKTTSSDAVTVATPEKLASSISRWFAPGQSSNSLTPPATQVTVGSTVTLTGLVYADSYGVRPRKSYTKLKCRVTQVNLQGTCPYHLNTMAGTELGWTKKGSVVLA